jgi:outer membrane receptor protein involved in Fe transport
MSMQRGFRIPSVLLVACLCLLALPFVSAPLQAQSTTATIQGTVADEGGVLPGATITARETQSGFQYDAVSGGDGGFTLAGLKPGSYEITVSMDKYKPQSRTVQVLVGQAITLSFKIAPDVVVMESVQVVGSRLIDTRTPEVATSVTQDQIRLLPQNDRNFLNFAALAPGVRTSYDDQNKQMLAGAQPAFATNVFIDGVSYKNDVLEGGVVGQDSSRGNPFPQNAVQEFKVVTQNFKAEYEKASSAIVTAVTRSGSNIWSGEGFVEYQDKALVQKDEFAKKRGDPKPDYQRFQPGLSLGGPIIKDKMQVFGSYEENRQNRDAAVVLQGGALPPNIDLTQFSGQFPNDFREKLLFTKVSAQPRSRHTFDATYNYRRENEARGFGLGTAYDAAENAKVYVHSGQGRYQIAGDRLLSQTTVSFQQFEWNPEPLNPDQVGLNYQGTLRIGGRDTTQDFIQRRIQLRQDLTHFTDWHGTHSLKAGAVLGFLKYDVTKYQNGNPQFTFKSDISLLFPAEAAYGVGQPNITTNNREFGFYAQDDWAITPRFTVNAGLRWDYESDMLDNDYVTPQNVRDAVAPLVDGSRYFSDGTQRPPFYRAWQPRVGASYDLTGQGKTVAFGGWGRYYDRVLYNYTFDERYRLQFATRTFRFSADGLPRDGVQTIQWNPSYLSKAGLDGLIASGVAPNPEVFLIDNNTRPPLSDQFNVGVRHSVKGVLFSATYAGVRSRNGFTFLFGNRNPDGSCCQGVPGFSNILISSDAKKSWYDAFFFTAEKPYGTSGNWGFSLTYTLGKAEQIGGDLFSLDHPTVAAYPRYPTSTDERNRIVATGIVGLKWNLILSGLLTLGSGLPFTVTDQSQGSGPNQSKLLLNGGRPEQFTFIFPDAFAYRSVDVRLEKIFRFGARQSASIALEGFNIFSFSNYKDFDGFIPPLPRVNDNFGKPSATLDPGRRLQFGLRYSF